MKNVNSDFSFQNDCVSLCRNAYTVRRRHVGEVYQLVLSVPRENVPLLSMQLVAYLQEGQWLPVIGHSESKPTVIATVGTSLR